MTNAALDIFSRLASAEALVHREWHHGGDLLRDAEIELGVCHDLFDT
jgi:hypothetical protein